MLACMVDVRNGFWLIFIAARTSMFRRHHPRTLAIPTCVFHTCPSYASCVSAVSCSLRPVCKLRRGCGLAAKVGLRWWVRIRVSTTGGICGAVSGSRMAVTMVKRLPRYYSHKGDIHRARDGAPSAIHSPGPSNTPTHAAISACSSTVRLVMPCRIASRSRRLVRLAQTCFFH